MRIAATVFLLASFAFPQTTDRARATHRRASSLSGYIDALVKAPKLTTYSNDGAADATVTEVGSNDMGIVENPIQSVRDIVNLGANAIPLLIAHLDDTRLTSAIFDPNRRKPVPVGYVCLDILTNIVRARNILIENCVDDGLGACIKRGYYFRPDAYDSEGSRYVAHANVRRVKLKWRQAYLERRVRFRFPSSWRRSGLQLGDSPQPLFNPAS
jgi:hypothetical protein